MFDPTSDGVTVAQLKAFLEGEGVTVKPKSTKAGLVSLAQDIISQADVPEHDVNADLAFTEAVMDVLGGADPEATADRLIAEDAEDVEPEDVDVEITVAAVDRLARLSQAKAEHAATKAWIEAGAIGDKPATPNLDAVQADATYRNANGGKSPSGSTSRKGPKYPPYARFDEAKQPGRARGGIKISEPDLRAWIDNEIVAHPDNGRFQMLEVCCLLEGFSCGDARFNKAWEDVKVNGNPVPAEVVEEPEPEPVVEPALVDAEEPVTKPVARRKGKARKAA